MSDQNLPGADLREFLTPIQRPTKHRDSATITIILEGTPCPKARPRFGRGYVYTPQRTVDHQYTLGWKAKAAMAGRRPIKGAVKLTVRFEIPIPPSWSVAQRARAIAGLIPPTAKPDLDNFLKAALDAINGIVVTDDAQVIEIDARKIYGVAPKTIMTVSSLSGERNE